jgi:hypothetical protein
VAEEQPSLVDLALDVLVFAPLGAAVEARRLLPELARVGREHLDQRMPSYRAVGQLAVGQARKEAGSRLRRLGLVSPPADSGPGTVPPQRSERPHGSAPAQNAAPRPAPATPRVPPSPEGPDVSALPIEGYDELSAVQVLPNLTGLDAGELQLVADYERATRSRRTILGRIDQLLEKRA